MLSVFITAAIFIFSEWLKLDFMVKSTVGEGVVRCFTIAKTVLLDENLFICQEMLSGRFFIMLGRWLEFHIGVY